MCFEKLPLPVLRSMAALAALVVVTLVRAEPGIHLHDAVNHGDLPRVQSLLMDRADVNALNGTAETPLMAAALAGNGEIASYLLQRGADVGLRSAKGLTALHAAAYSGHRDIAALLLAKGADIDDADNPFKVTPLHLASEQNHTAVVELLLSKGAAVNPLEVQGYTPLSRAGWRKNWDVVVVLQTHGATCQPVDATDKWLHDECTKRAKARQ